MIILDSVTKRFKLNSGGFRYTLNEVSYIFNEGVNTGILGINGAGKSTLLKLLCGSSYPTSGRIVRSSSISWPVGFAGYIIGSLSGYQNLRFISRIYRSDYHKDKSFVEDFTELGDYLYEPVKTYSSGMRAKLVFALSMSIGFDFYLVDEAFSVGDSQFKEKGMKLFREKSKSATLLIVSHNVNNISKFCNKALVLNNGKLVEFNTLDESVNFYKKLH
jgi:capsular polysaccharide transport system ATP-binding protein